MSAKMLLRIQYIGLLIMLLSLFYELYFTAFCFALVSIISFVYRKL
ncbi:hypothetical protein JOD14_001937 [Enterococcus lemanii]|jgi:hypothetical protein|nr:hypothetical protein [Enterococcus lemanii]